MPHLAIDDTPPTLSRLERFPVARQRPLIGYAAALAAVGLAWLLRVLVDGMLPPGFPYVTFFPAVALVSFFFGTRAGLLSAGLAGLISWYQFIEPRGSLTLSGPAIAALAFYILVIGVNILLIHWMQAATGRLSLERKRSTALAEQRRLLFEELQHRVSNNLQVIGALITAQKRQVADEAARLVLDQAAQRLSVIGQISRELYQHDGARTNIADLLARLTGHVLDASGRQADITLRLDVDDALNLDPSKAVPLALVYTEVLSNTLEHGVPTGTGMIDVRLRRTDAAQIALTVTDDGAGLPTGFRLDETNSLGLRVARQLARQLGGAFTLTPAAGGRGAQALLLIAG